MNLKKILSAATAGVIAAASLACAAFAADDIVLVPDEDTGLTKVTDEETAVVFVGKGYKGIVGGEDNGQWILGGDNGDIGISYETLKEYSYVELDYTCDNPIDGVKIGFAFKVHVDMESRVCEDGGYIFADYLPATWVPYGSGADGKQPIQAINSLEEIYQTDLKASGTLSVSVETLLEFFPEDADYLMGLGIGANNNHEDIAEADLDEGEAYNITVTAVRFTNTQTVEDEEDNAAQDTDSTDSSASSSSVGIVIAIIIVVVVIAAIVIVIVVVLKKKKK